MVVKLLSAAAIAAAATTAQGAFSIGSTDFGGGFGGTNGNPLVPVGGAIVNQANTDAANHSLLVSFGLYGVQGYGSTFGAIEDNAPAEGPPYAGLALTVNALAAIVPAGGAGAATAGSFGGFYARGPVLTTDDDAFVARIRVTGNGTLTTSGPVFVAVQGTGDATESILGIDESGVVSITSDNRTDGANYALDIRFLTTDSGDSFYDVFVVVPTPGTAALFGVAGLATIRRRRA